METCSKCGSIVVERDPAHNIVKAAPHITCENCGTTFCYPCVKNAPSCPNCGLH